MKKILEKKYVSISEAASIIGVSSRTLREWNKLGKFVPSTTLGTHRRYSIEQLNEYLGNKTEEKKDTKIVVAVYARVSSQEQKTKGDLERQKNRLVEYCAKQGYKTDYIFEEVGSGMSDTRTKLQKLFELVSEKKIQKVIVEHKDRLTRFMFGVYQSYFSSYGVEIVCVEQTLPKSFENELVEDMISLMASFSAKVYGRRSADRRKVSK